MKVCPECGFAGETDEFDCAGACGANLFCPMCNTEIDELTGLKHVCSPILFESCRQNPVAHGAKELRDQQATAQQQELF